jgi:hypothetical protein
MDSLYELLSDIYPVIMSLAAGSGVIGAIFWFIMIMTDKRQRESFDKKYRETRKHEGYKPRR